MTDNTWPAQSERRANHEVRAVFVQACELLTPFFKGNEKAPGVSKFAMVHMLNDHFPTLSSSQAHIAISAIERLHREGRLQKLLEK